MDHEPCDPTLSKVNNVNDKSSKSNSTSAMGVLDHGARDTTQPGCNSIDTNDTACSDVISEIGVEKDLADNSNVSVIVVDSGFLPPS